jgi:hypothetical protein
VKRVAMARNTDKYGSVISLALVASLAFLLDRPLYFVFERFADSLPAIPAHSSKIKHVSL